MDWNAIREYRHRIIRLVFCFSFNSKKSSIGFNGHGKWWNHRCFHRLLLTTFFFHNFSAFPLKFPTLVCVAILCLSRFKIRWCRSRCAQIGFAGSRRCVLSAFALISNYRSWLAYTRCKCNCIFRCHKHMTHVSLFSLRCAGKWFRWAYSVCVCVEEKSNWMNESERKNTTLQQW